MSTPVDLDANASADLDANASADLDANASADLIDEDVPGAPGEPPPDAVEMTMAQALRDATAQQMRRDPSVFVMGQGVDDIRGMFGTTLDLHVEFGDERNLDVPLAEDGMTGVGVGAALAGLRPIQVHQRMDFLLLCMNQLVNVAAKTSYMFDGAHRVPLVIRAIIGRSWGQGAQHSQALHSWLMHVPGLRVLAPTTPHDAKGCLATAVRDDNPVVIVEHRMLHSLSGIVPTAEYHTPYARARRLLAGDDITIVGISHMAVEAVRAAHLLHSVGVRAEVIDPVSLSPLDVDGIAAAAARTGKLLVVDTSWLACGAAGEIALSVIEACAGDVSVDVARMGYQPTPCPTAPELERAFYPSAVTIADRALQLIDGRRTSSWDTTMLDDTEITAFRGPF